MDAVQRRRRDLVELETRSLRPVDGQTLRAWGRPSDVYVGRGQPWRVLVTGRECDNGSLSASSITSPPSPCPRGTGEFLDLIGDDAPGSVADGYRTPAAADGEHVSDALVAGSSCPPVNRRGCYAVTYGVTIVHDEARRATAASRCGIVTVMAKKKKEKDVVKRLAVTGEEALSKIAELPGGAKIVEAATALRDRVDELGKRMRSIDPLERRVAELEKRLEELAKPRAAREGRQEAGAEQALL